VVEAILVSRQHAPLTTAERQQVQELEREAGGVSSAPCKKPERKLL
jgi:hypothetical protein